MTSSVEVPKKKVMKKKGTSSKSCCCKRIEGQLEFLIQEVKGIRAEVKALRPTGELASESECEPVVVVQVRDLDFVMSAYHGKLWRHFSLLQ